MMAAVTPIWQPRLTTFRMAYSSHNVEMERSLNRRPIQPQDVGKSGEKTAPTVAPSDCSDPSVYRRCRAVMEDVNYATCSKARCSCREGRSHYDVRVKLTTSDGSVEGGGPGRTSVTRTCKSKLRNRGRNIPCKEATGGQKRGDWWSKAERSPDQRCEVRREVGMVQSEALR